ncbi:hypothetical protein GDO86_005216 [Hymenochirus boettgeri]|uniref:Uncharacterized protein n=1 Tax=Hymenochirus boettgeri TaxID=247094 RepID=A0A8T2J5L8_9PIPI|nr:hypothetical protein GDO86_005216 [Hymenochirus boettgeri]
MIPLGALMTQTVRRSLVPRKQQHLLKHPRERPLHLPQSQSLQCPIHHSRLKLEKLRYWPRLQWLHQVQ